ncbi:hypothetical protein AHEVV1_010 [Adoxophyes honmai entomopoxvirus 'L' virophage 1]|nr:hypothetical protein AHEVV1_010 [Adoxophyes honmai entomopoxvirus 'L' virophage 1]
MELVLEIFKGNKNFEVLNKLSKIHPEVNEILIYNNGVVSDICLEIDNSYKIPKNIKLSAKKLAKKLGDDKIELEAVKFLLEKKTEKCNEYKELYEEKHQLLEDLKNLSKKNISDEELREEQNRILKSFIVKKNGKIVTPYRSKKIEDIVEEYIESTGINDPICTFNNKELKKIAQASNSKIRTKDIASVTVVQTNIP